MPLPSIDTSAGTQPVVLPPQPQASAGTPAAGSSAGTGGITAPALARQQATRDAPAVNTNLHGAAAPGEAGFFAKIRHWLSNAVTRAFGSGYTLPDPIQINLPSRGETVSFPSEKLAPMIDALPRSQRAGAAANLAQTLAARIERGGTLLNQALSGQLENVSPNTQDVADIMLFLDVKAEQAGFSFIEGSFSIEDPSGYLARYLDRCPERYQRTSSHLDEHKSAIIDGHVNNHRGIDIPRGPNGLGSDKGTVLFGTIPAGPHTARRLFLKAENYGCKLSTLLPQRDLVHRGLAPGANPDRKIWLGADLDEAFLHMVDFFKTRGQGSAAGTRKERIPDAVKTAYANLVGSLPSDSPTRAMLMRDGPLTKCGGIHVMLKNIRDAEASITDPAARQRFSGMQSAFRAAIAAMPDQSHMDVRIGNEVIFDVNELA